MSLVHVPSTSTGRDDDWYCIVFLHLFRVVSHEWRRGTTYEWHTEGLPRHRPSYGSCARGPQRHRDQMNIVMKKSKELACDILTYNCTNLIRNSYFDVLYREYDVNRTKNHLMTIFPSVYG